MKKSITSMISRALGGSALALLALLPSSGNAQWCSATSYPTYYYNGQYGGAVTDITVANGSGTLASYSGLGHNEKESVLNNGTPFDVYAGEILTVTLTGTSDMYGWGYGTSAGIWIDGDRNGSFSGAECAGDPQSGPFSGLMNSTITAQIKVPCGTAGATRIRIRSASSVFCCGHPYELTPQSGCGMMYVDGSQYDLLVNLKLGGAPVAAFNVPTGPNYVKSPITFNASSPNTYFQYYWDFNPQGTAGSGTPASATGAKAKSKWDNANTYDVKLVVDYCGLKDSVTNLVKIVSPTSVPVADFIANSNLIEIYYDAILYDLSTNGAYKWAWEATSPTGNVYTSSSEQGIFNLDEVGKWDFCLTSENDIGPSNKICKSKYVECSPPGEFYMGPNKLGTNKNGILYDNGGPDADYGNNRKVTIDYFKILPCGAKEISFFFDSLVLDDGNDILRIYDGQDEAGILLTPAGGINGNNYQSYRHSVFKATSGAMYITFESNGTGTAAGFIARWESDLLPPAPPKASWTTAYNPVANGMEVVFKSDIAESQGAVSYDWWLDGFSGMGSDPTWDWTFTTDGQYDICLVASTCNGADTFCSTIDVVTPTGPWNVDFKASNLRPKAGEVVEFTTSTDYANAFEWSIFPFTYTYVSGNANSQNPKIRFNAAGAYTFTLKAWNTVGGSITEKKLIKNKYIIVLDYCIPPVDLLSSDVGINQVLLSKDGNTLMDNQTKSGEVPYNDYTESLAPTELTFGAKYDLFVARKTNSNAINYKAWIDLNIDGDFIDAGEEVMNTGAMMGYDASSSFTVPPLAASFEGITRLRIGASYGAFSNTPCGVNIVGEFEDYPILLSNDMLPPSITLVGADTIRVEKGSSPTSCYGEVAGLSYSASDPTEGDMTAKVVVVTDLDCTVPGIYSFEFTVKDASGNAAVPRRRTVIVVLDKTPPVMTLNGVSPMTIEQCDAFNDPGAIATDLVDGNLTTAIIVTGSVDASKTGSYTLTYTASDAQGNSASLIRIVNVVDTKKPGIYLRGSRIVDNTTINVQINGVFVDEVYGADDCNGIINVMKIAGFNGFVNTQARATYPIYYYSEDPSGNKADEDGFVINYKVDDFIEPVISLNTDDTVLHDVNNPYYSRPVSVSDNYYTIDKVSTVKTGSVDPYTLGIYAETYTATDESGNVMVKTRFVKVVDREAPSLLAPAVNACVGSPFWAYSGLVIEDNYYSPGTLLPLVKVLNHNVNIWEAGAYYINYSLTDPSGNKALLVSRTVFVQYEPNCKNTFTGIENIKLEDAVNIYPNPTSGEITISYGLGNTNPVNVVITNAAGAKVAELNGLKGGFNATKIDLSEYGSGTYFVRLTNNNESTTRSIVVSH